MGQGLAILAAPRRGLVLLHLIGVTFPRLTEAQLEYQTETVMLMAGLHCAAPF